MTNNQLYINECIQTIFGKLRTYDKAVKLWGEKKEEIIHSPLWSQEEMERRTSAATAELREAAQRFYDAIAKELESIKQTAIVMENEFVLSSELSAAIAMVCSVGADLPYETRHNLVQTFVGQKQALIALISIMEVKGVDVQEAKSYIFKAEYRCEELDNLAYQIVAQAGINVGVVINFVRELEKFAELMGVELSNKFVSENESAYMSARLRESFGLPVN